MRRQKYKKLISEIALVLIILALLFFAVIYGSDTPSRTNLLSRLFFDIGCWPRCGGGGGGSPPQALFDDFIIDIGNNQRIDQNTVSNVAWDGISSYYPTGGSGEIPDNSPGLAALWHMNDDLADGMAQDSSGNGNHGRCSGNACPLFTTGRFNNGYEFDGVNDEIDINSSESLDALDRMTVSLWAKTFNVGGPDQTLISFYKTSGDRVFVWLDDVPAWGITIYNNIDNQNEYPIRTGWTPGNDEWFHLVWVVDGTDWSLYINGQKWSSPEGTTMADLDDGFVAGIGKRAVQNDRPWKGVIDEAATWNRALSEEEIQALYSGVQSGGSFESIVVNTGRIFDGMLVQWQESAAGVVMDVSLDGGNNWCRASNNGLLDENNCVGFPAAAFKYRVGFVGDTLLDNVRFEWSEAEPGEPFCILSANPASGAGPFDSVLRAVFSNLPDGIIQALMKCEDSDSGEIAAIVNNIATRTCSYPAVEEQTFFYPRASTAVAQCSAAVIDYPQQECLSSPGAHNYYVDGGSRCGSCSDNNPGTLQQPWCTIDKALSTVGAGDHILIQPGEYYEGDLVLDDDGYELPLTGTVQCTYGSITITGVGTQFSSIEPGDFIRCDRMPTENTMGHRPGAFFPWTEVLSIEDDTHLTLREPYRGETDNDGADNDKVGKFIVLEGIGADPDDVKIIGRATENAFGLTYEQYTGAPFDCDEEASGIQDCTNVYYFELEGYTYNDIDPGEFGAIFQRDTSLTRYPFDVEQHDKAYFHGIDPYLSMNRESHLDCGNNDPDMGGGESTCSSWATCAALAIPRVNKVPGVMWVDRGSNPDRWYFQMRNGQTPVQQHDLIEIANKGKVLDLKGADYVILKKLAIWVGAEEARETYGGFVFNTGTGNDVSDWVLIDDLRHYGGRAKLATGDHQHIVIEDSKFRGGSDFAGVWKASAFINSEVSGGGHYNWDMKPGNLTATSWEEGVILDRMFIHHALAYYWDYRCTPGDDEQLNFDWQTGQWQKVHGNHTWQGKFQGEERPDYFWVQNSVIGKGSDPIQIGAYPQGAPDYDGPSAEHFKWVFNNNYPYDGNDGDQGMTPLFKGGDTLATTRTDHTDFLHLGNVWYWKNTQNPAGRSQSLVITEADYNDGNGARLTSDYNAYFYNRPEIYPVWGVGGQFDSPTWKKTFSEIQARGFDLNSVFTPFDNTAAYWNGFFEDIQLGDNFLDFTPRIDSDLIDKIPFGQYYCPDHDFYGNPRVDGMCDIGAVERQPALKVPPSPQRGGLLSPSQNGIGETLPKVLDGLIKFFGL